MFVRRVGYHPFYFLYTLITSTEQSMEATQKCTTQKGGSILRSLMPSSANMLQKNTINSRFGRSSACLKEIGIQMILLDGK